MKMSRQTKWTALYERLSRDDEGFGDSVSIGHQKTYLREYAESHGFSNCHDYTDDGWSGGNFNRPAWNQMIADVEDGKVGAVIVKDMSRVGRDHLQTGFYTEVYFSRHGVRFIAIDSRVDNESRDSNEFAPLLNVFNEMYLHDQSRKVKIGYHAKGASGRTLVSTPNFGYLKDPEDKERWIIDQEAAATVRRVFELAAEGHNSNQIAGILRDEQRITPGSYFAARGQNNRCHARKKDTGPYDWTRSSVTLLLQTREYLGDTVNFKTAKASYKSKRMFTPEAEQLVFAGTHEAIIDQETWDKAQQTLQRRTRTPSTPIVSPWKGKVFCARCGAPMYALHQRVKRCDGSEALSESFVCSTHRNTIDKRNSPCSANTFSEKVLRALLTDTIRTISRYAMENEEEFLARLQNGGLQKSDESRNAKKRISTLERRAGELNRLLKKLYEDYALDRITENRFDALSAEYEAELARTEALIAEEKQLLAQRTSTKDNAERFMMLVRRFRDRTDYTDEQLLLFTDRVIVHETKRDADGERSRRIDIRLSFIGDFHIPAESCALSEEDMKREAELKKRRIHDRKKRKENRLAKEAAKRDEQSL